MLEKPRSIHYHELEPLLDLYGQLHPDDPDVRQLGSLAALWNEIYNDPNLHYIVIEKDGRIISSCTISVIKNLTRNLRPYGLIENVITHSEYRNQGLGTAVLHKALAIAQENDCYKVMLLTSSKLPETLNFYEKAGFIQGIKTGFVKVL